jgi:hypothetical protein
MKPSRAQIPNSKSCPSQATDYLGAFCEDLMRQIPLLFCHFCRMARAIATMPSRMGSGNFVHAAMSVASSESASSGFSAVKHAALAVSADCN